MNEAREPDTCPADSLAELRRERNDAIQASLIDLSARDSMKKELRKVIEEALACNDDYIDWMRKTLRRALKIIDDA